MDCPFRNLRVQFIIYIRIFFQDCDLVFRRVKFFLNCMVIGTFDVYLSHYIFLYYHHVQSMFIWQGMFARCQSTLHTFMCKALVITFSLPSLHNHYPYSVGSSRFIMIIRALFRINPIICFRCNLVMRLKAILGIIRCI